MYMTHIGDESSVTNFLPGLILPDGSQCLPSGKIRPGKKLVTERLIPYVCKLKNDLF